MCLQSISRSLLSLLLYVSAAQQGGIPKDFRGRTFLRQAWVSRSLEPMAEQEEASERTTDPTSFEIFKHRNNVIKQSENDSTAVINAAPPKLAVGTTALDWWLRQAQRATYPALSKMVINVLAARPMSVESESVFCGSRRTI